jgi:hypothetical protein
VASVRFLGAGLCAGASLLTILATSPAQAAEAGQRPLPSQFFRLDVPRRSIVVRLVAGLDGSNGGFNFDGYGRGELLVTVPKGWQVTVQFENMSAEPTSCAVVSGPDATTVAFPGASTPSPVQGLPTGRRATFSFRATRTGSFRFASMVPGQEQARMYDVLEVVRAGRASISARPGP